MIAKNDFFLIPALFQDISRNTGAADIRLADFRAIAISHQQNFVESNRRAGFAGQFFDFHFVANGDFVLFPSCFYYCNHEFKACPVAKQSFCYQGVCIKIQSRQKVKPQPASSAGLDLSYFNYQQCQTISSGDNKRQIRKNLVISYHAFTIAYLYEFVNITQKPLIYPVISLYNI